MFPTGQNKQYEYDTRRLLYISCVMTDSGAKSRRVQRFIIISLHVFPFHTACTAA